MDESILTSIKKMLGPTEMYEQFDTDIIIHINSMMSLLTQLGIGPPGGFSIEDKTAKWSDYIDEEKFNMVKTFIYIGVKLVFDPPLNASVIASLEKTKDELEWRLNVAAETEFNDN